MFSRQLSTLTTVGLIPNSESRPSNNAVDIPLSQAPPAADGGNSHLDEMSANGHVLSDNMDDNGVVTDDDNFTPFNPNHDHDCNHDRH